MVVYFRSIILRIVFLKFQTMLMIFKFFRSIS